MQKFYAYAKKFSITTDKYFGSDDYAVCTLENYMALIQDTHSYANYLTYINQHSLSSTFNVGLMGKQEIGYIYQMLTNASEVPEDVVLAGKTINACAMFFIFVNMGQDIEGILDGSSGGMAFIPVILNIVD